MCCGAANNKLKICNVLTGTRLDTRSVCPASQDTHLRDYGLIPKDVFILNQIKNGCTNYQERNLLLIACMIYSSMNSSILREARMANMILCIDIILHEHSTVVQLNRLSLCRLSPFLLYPPASLYCYSERCTCASLFSNRPEQGEDVKS